MISRLIYCIIGFILLTSCGAGKNNQPQPQNNYLEMYSYAIVGQNSAIYASKDAVSWTKANVPESAIQHLNSIAYSKDFFVAVGDIGEVVFSIDGINWHLADSINKSDFNLNYIIPDTESNQFTAIGAGGYAKIFCTYLGTKANECITYKTFFLLENDTNLVNAVYANNILTAVGNDKLGRLISKNSKNDFTWTLEKVVSNLPDKARSIFNTESQFILIAQNKLIVADNPSFESSVHYTNNDKIKQIVNYSGTYLAINNNQLLSSNSLPNNWNIIESFTFPVTYILSTDSNILISGGNGKIIVGQPGRLDIQDISNSPILFNAIAFNPNFKSQ